MSAANLGHVLAQWVIDAGISTQEDYEAMVWNKTKEVMQEFVHYMEREDIILYATACGNAAWKHHKYLKDPPMYGQKVGDIIVCVLMVGALYFMNGWTIAQMPRTPADDNSERIRDHLRCIIVHMFSEVLNATVCKSEWGTFYAWHIMAETAGIGGVSSALIQNRTCAKETFAHLKIKELDLNKQVAAWLTQNPTLKSAIKKVQGTEACGRQRKRGWTLDNFLRHENTEDT
ncbi:hypothetical protein AK88_04183 [Plasmodium fragile]|uniref:Uncharacterized protein n=1 Tax=Plasmodium fragile TaxID=5857 RepID=A0A0D9QHF2_PLAFR|nr:uncharacterized protein AK88_04183 [Plasmodium fragile]KJP86212.1 hypothetical protein AK88_04183 [Plasmodium fragile]